MNTLTHSNEGWMSMLIHPAVKQGKVDQAIKVLTEHGSKLLNVDDTIIWQINQAGGILSCLDHYQHSTHTHTRISDLSISSFTRFHQAIQTQPALAVREVASNLQTRELFKEFWKPRGVRSTLIIPVWMQGGLWGVFEFDQKDAARIWKQDDISKASHLTNVLSQTILVHQIQELDHQVIEYQQTIQKICTQGDLTVILHTLLEQTLDFTNADAGMIYLSSPNRQELRCFTSVNVPEPMTRVVIPFGQGTLGMIAERRSTLIVDDYSSWEPKDAAYQHAGFIKVTAGVPVLSDGETVGVLQVIRKKADAPFEQRDVERLKGIAGQIAMLTAYQRAMERGRFMDLFSRVLRLVEPGVYSSPSLEGVLTQILQFMHAECGFVQFQDTQASVNIPETITKNIHRILCDSGKWMTSNWLINDWTASREINPQMADEMLAANIHATIFVPIQADRISYGCLGICSQIPRDWTLDEISALETVSRLLGASFTRRLVFQIDQTIIGQLSRYGIVTENLNRLLSYREALQNIGNGLINIFHPDRAAIYLRKHTGEVSCAWMFGLPDTYVADFNLQETRTPSFLLRTTRPLFIGDTTGETYHLDYQAPIIPEQTRSLCLSPLIYDGTVVGMLGCYFDTTHSWSDAEKHILSAFANHATVTLWNSWLLEQVDAGYKRVALALANAVDARESSQPGYSERLAHWVEAVGTKIGVSQQDLDDLRWAARLHDIGKNVVPDEILRKKGTLTSDEWRTMRRAPVEAQRILSAIPDMRNVSEIIRSVRERFDGSGYPDGLKGEEIPIGARIVAVADAYGSLIDQRPYRRAMTHDEAILELRRSSGKQFDPKVVESFITVFKERVN